MDELADRLRALARVPVLLVATDYDGTLAPIVPDPTKAQPDRESMVAIRNLAALPATHVAIISGRALKTLADLVGSPHSVHLVGSHGSEFDPGFADALPPEKTALRTRIETDLTAIAQSAPGFLLERKPASIAFHYRAADDRAADAALRDILRGPAKLDGVMVHHGKRVVELSVVESSKARALETVRQRVGASAVIFLGDDQTDETAFSVLTGPDVAIKIGEGDTLARHRLRSHRDVARLLARLAELRTDWAVGAAAAPIERHSIISDQRTIALINAEATLTWLCLPRLDSAAMFAELLGGPPAGRFGVQPRVPSAAPRQEYLGSSMILRTSWPEMSVTDFFDCSAGRPVQRAGRSDLLRILEGSGRALIEFAPRIDFGRVATRVKVLDGGLEIEDTVDPIVLRAPGVSWEIVQEGIHQTARGVVDLSAGPVALELRYGIGTIREGTPRTAERQRLTDRFWSGWAEQLSLPRLAPDLVRRSALVLKALCYGPTGAIAAAATTSLPEHIGGVRNWDYRYCWLRDAAMSAAALVKLGSHAEAMEYLDWVLGVVDSCQSPERLKPLYTLAGHNLGPEAEIAELSGYRGSRPVRIGNAASGQVQLDVFGPIVELVHLLVLREAPLSSEHWRLVEAMVEAVSRRWHEPDHGIWEIRLPRRHHTHSKVMCWLAVDRAIDVAQRFLGRSRPAWEELRAAIAADVLSKGFKEDVGAFTAAYDGTDLDAAALAVGLSGLLPADDPRFAGTVRAVEEGLRQGPTVYRYRMDDGLPGFEGGFHICASWLIDAYLMTGRRADAEALFADLVALAGPTGMLSEQYAPTIGQALGNHPQAYSHLGIIENALRLST
ncbi:MAG: trehalose-phosphatase [Phycisphaerales bacterium]